MLSIRILLVATTQSTRKVINADDVKQVLEQQSRNNSGGQGGVTRQVTIHHEAVIQADSLDDLEARYITGLLTKNSNNRKRVASVMGVSERTLYRKIKRFSLD